MSGKTLIGVGISLVMLLLLAAVGGVATSNKDLALRVHALEGQVARLAARGDRPVSVDIVAAHAPEPPPVVAPKREVVAPPTPPAAKSFTDGTYLVGEDIPAGTYRGTVISEMGMGYWARLRDTEGDMNSTIANGVPQGPFVLTIKSSDVAVQLQGVRLQAK